MASTRCTCLLEVLPDGDGWDVRLIVADPDCRATHAVVVES